MNWKTNHRVPEVTEWICGIKDQWYPMRCFNCHAFPTVLVKFDKIMRRVCSFCRIEEYL